MKNLKNVLGTKTFIALIIATVLLIASVIMLITVICTDHNEPTAVDTPTTIEETEAPKELWNEGTGTKYYIINGGYTEVEIHHSYYKLYEEKTDFKIKFRDNGEGEWAAEFNGYLIVLDPTYDTNEMLMTRYKMDDDGVRTFDKEIRCYEITQEEYFDATVETTEEETIEENKNEPKETVDINAQFEELLDALDKLNKMED